MSQENQAPGKILFVDDEDVMRRLITRVAQRVGVDDLEVFEDAESTVARLAEVEEIAAGVISDGLNGGWKRVVSAAQEAGVPVVVFTGDDHIQEVVEAAGATYVSKPAISMLLKQFSHNFSPLPTPKSRYFGIIRPR